MRMFLNEMDGIVIDTYQKIVSIIFQEVVCYSRSCPLHPLVGCGTSE
jgi:hypothetical protein